MTNASWLSVSSHSSLAAQGVRFAIVGGVATVTHMLTVVALMELLTFPFASIANVLGVIAGSTVAYLGHCFWTFGADGRHVTRVARFAVSYGVVFAVNGLIMLLAADMAGIPYGFPLAVSLCLTPVLTFVLNRYWVFA